MFKSEKEMTAKEHRAMEKTKIRRHDEIAELIQQLEKDEIDTFEFRKKTIEIMENPMFISSSNKTN